MLEGTVEAKNYLRFCPFNMCTTTLGDISTNNPRNIYSEKSLLFLCLIDSMPSFLHVYVEGFSSKSRLLSFKSSQEWEFFCLRDMITPLSLRQSRIEFSLVWDKAESSLA
jgi:hypothetical protein